MAQCIRTRQRGLFTVSLIGFFCSLSDSVGIGYGFIAISSYEVFWRAGIVDSDVFGVSEVLMLVLRLK